MIKQLLALLACLFLAQTHNSITEFEIRKRHPNWHTSVLLGKLTINILHESRAVESYIDPLHTDLVTEADFQDDNPIIIEFVPVKSDSSDYKDRVYMASVDEINRDPHGQKISIILGSNEKHLSVNSINYVQTRDRIGQIYTEVIYPREKLDEPFKIQLPAKRSEQEDESFFARYKWPLIIGGVLLFTMMTTSPEKGGEGAAAPA